jgi:hypothetical protein
MPEIAPPLVWLTALAGWRYLVVRSTGAEPGSLTAV